MFKKDKLKHYTFCKELCEKIYNKTKKYKLLIAILVFITVTVYKEFIHDLILRKGNFELKDIYANYSGCKDFYLGV